MCAVGTAVKISAGFDSVPDDFAPAMVAFGSQNVNGTFEGIKVMGDAVHHNFQGLIIFISADFTLRHKISLLLATRTCFGQPIVGQHIL